MERKSVVSWKPMIGQPAGELTRDDGTLVQGLAARRVWLACVPLALAFLVSGLIARLVDAQPIGQYWWDSLALSGAAEAINQGLVPSIDFWSPMVAPIYLKWLALELGGVGNYYFIEHALMAGLGGAFYVALFWRRLPPWGFWVFLVLTLLIAGLPFNQSSVISSKQGYLNYAASYNRFCDALLLITFLIPAAFSSVRRLSGGDLLVVGLMALVLAYTKVSALQVMLAVLMVWALFLRSRELGLQLTQVLVGCVLAAVLIWALTGIGPGYLQALDDVAAVKRVTAVMDLPKRLFLTWQRQWFQALVLAGGTAWAFWLTLRHGPHLLRTWRFLMLAAWYAVCMGGVIMFSSTNHGDVGLMPLAAFAWSSLYLHRQLRAEGSVGHGKLRGDRVLLILAALLVVSSFVGYGRWLRHMVQADRTWINMPVENAYFRDNVRVNVEDWARRPTLTRSIKPERTELTASVPSFGGYVEAAMPAIRFLEREFPSRMQTVYALDFPSYLFTLTSQFAVPRGTYPWLLYRHELLEASHPAPELLFKHVDIVALNRCSLHVGNRLWMPKLFLPYVRQHYQLMFQSNCWELYGNEATMASVRANGRHAHAALPVGKPRVIK